MIAKRFFFIVLFCFSFNLGASTIDSMLVESKSMNKKIKVVVILPSSYSKNQSFKVVYLLHGFGDNQNAWLTSPTNKNLVPTLADKYNFIIVCPDAGRGSFYVNSPEKKNIQYETFITHELVTFVDGKFNTVKSKEGRFITGLSMGGHGALFLAIKNSHYYLSAGSISGAFDLTKLKYEHLIKNFQDLLGKEYEERLKDISIVSLINELKSSKLPVIIDCGVSDILYEDNKSFHQILLKESIPHDYTERPGEHNWEYFSNSLEYHLLFFQKQLEKVK